MKNNKKTVIAVVITAIASIILTTAALSSVALVFLIRGHSFLDKISIVDYIIDKYFLYDYDKEQLDEAAVKAYIAALDEPYTEYYSPEEFSDYIESIQDGYVGIGIMVGVNDNDEIVVIAPFEGSPAYNAGIASGDILRAVDGTYYTGSELNEAVSAIRGGNAGSEVDITIKNKDDEEITLIVERSDISDKSVKAEMLDSNIGYIRISQFNMESEDKSHSTSTEFRAQLNELLNMGMDRLIIDLRDNPGGILEEACDIADALLDEGVITYTEDKNGKRQYYNSDEEHTDIPIAVLINKNSASAAEVLTGALKDRGRAVVIGETSFGKGIVQFVYTLPDGSGISLTSEQYFTPNGVCIHGIGINPDIEVELPEEYKDFYVSTIEHDKDTQLGKAVEIISEQN